MCPRTGAPLELQPGREPPAVVGQIDGQGEHGRVGDQDGVADRGREVGDVDVVGVVGEEPVAALDQVGDRGALAGGKGWPRWAISARRLATSWAWSWRTSRSTQATRVASSPGGSCSNAVIAEQVP